MSNKTVKIFSELLWGGERYKLEYTDLDSFDELPYEKCVQVYGVCFMEDKIVIGHGRTSKTDSGWNLIGGHIEKGETFEQTLRREIKEESNMELLNYLPIGVQKVTAPSGEFTYQLRYVTKVRPFGKFRNDPAGSVTDIMLIDPKNYRQYFDWGEIGERIISRAIEVKKRLL
ncbi:MAG: NUDIX domain-containing protein [Candidatus Shapirobacteria bacterium]|jgi:8-oxo-dGTP pyrophosphatase MutT (NUDIX family)